MKLFSTLYNKVIKLSSHPKSAYYLGGLSMAESSFFPIPPDVMLLPMSLAVPEKSWHYAFITTACSVIGGVIGYLIGMYFFEYFGASLIEFYSAGDKFSQVKNLFLEHGVWIILIASFTPLPYKLFTIMAGVLSMALLPFIIISIIGRGMRFYLVAGLASWFGKKYGEQLNEVIDIIGWVTLIIIAILLIVYVLFK